MSCGKSGCGVEHEHFHESGGGTPLFGYIDREHVYCLNEHISGAGKGVIKSWENRLAPLPELRSTEDDPELLLCIPFTAAVKIRCICLSGSVDGASPSRVKIYINKTGLDFSTVADMRPVQELLLAEFPDGIIDWPVNAAKFHNVTHITLHFCENFGADITRLTFVGFKGEGSLHTRGIVETVYESSAQMKDHKVKGEEKGGQFLSS